MTPLSEYWRTNNRFGLKVKRLKSMHGFQPLCVIFPFSVKR
ncbi:hypothetical protein HMPREF3226_00831 [Prevotella corporis]|uniref:Uncharacterized protein n=1 Tax=Prevotella corporis TaxID=28128 RepID=A0A133QF33_9BACT|nr:hypothetical protein HMPREF3226_00831 [Prevotella corporis]